MDKAKKDKESESETDSLGTRQTESEVDRLRARRTNTDKQRRREICMKMVGRRANLAMRVSVNETVAETNNSLLMRTIHVM